MTKLFNPQWSLERRRSLRGNMTEPEKRLWNALRKNSFGIKFRRQFGIGPYIVDFCSPMSEIVIEVDGDSHFDAAAIEYDKERDAYMNAMGIRVFRFTNEEVMRNLDGVLLRIQSITLPLHKGESEGVDPTGCVL